MRPLSSVDCVSPAISRTRLVLFSPFRFGRTWKLGMTAYLSFMGTLFVPFTLVYCAIAPFVARAGHHRAALAIVAGSILLTIAYVIIFLLCSRLQFAFFDIVLNRGQFVAPAWRKYGAVSRALTYWKVVIGLVLTLITAAPMIPFLRLMGRSMQQSFEAIQHIQPGQPPPPVVLDPMAGFWMAYFGFVFLFGFFYLFLSTSKSFVLPSMALEGISAPDAFRRFLLSLRQEPGAYLGFVALRAVLGIAGYIAVLIAYEIVLLLCLLVFGLVCVLVGFLLHALHIPSFVGMTLWVLAWVCFVFVFNGYLLGLAIGPFFTFFEAHTLYFLAGRYPLLGELLERSTPPPPAPLYGYAPPPPQWPAAPPVYPPVAAAPQPPQWHTAVYPPVPAAVETPPAEEPPLTHPPDVIDTTE